MTLYKESTVVSELPSLNEPALLVLFTQKYQFSDLPKPLRERIQAEISYRKQPVSFSFYFSSQLEVIVKVVRKSALTSKARSLRSFRSLGRRLASHPSETLILDLRAFNQQEQFLIADGVNSSIVAQLAAKPNYTEKKKPVKRPAALWITQEEHQSLLQSAITLSTNLTQASAYVRELALTPSNHLTPSQFRTTIESITKHEELNLKIHTIDALKKMGAGAFTAVGKASEDPNCGIYHLTYTPASSPRATVALIGKGITFDTGGVNLKTGPHMFGMHEDMTGAALCLSLIRLAKIRKWPLEIRAYLAITENLIDGKSFRPNDVVTSLSGKTIEIVDTDAEGRLILSDTLHLAAQAKPDLMLDFATLTGSCVRALGTLYSGVFSNKTSLFKHAIKAGTLSGERVWPFPNDPDHKSILKSQIADIRQCRLEGGPDHIDAFQFLKCFVPKELPWLHVDLSAAHHEGGLGPFASKTTGFGIRFATVFLENIFKLSL